MTTLKDKTESEIRDGIQEQVSKEVPYRPFGHEKIRDNIFKIVADQEGVELFDSLVQLFDSAIDKERSELGEQIRTDLDRIEFYVNNAGWDTEERRGREISTIWGLRNKYHSLVEEE